jgi:uncharacterized membrane protein YqiK
MVIAVVIIIIIIIILFLLVIVIIEVSLEDALMTSSTHLQDKDWSLQWWWQRPW